MIFDICIIGHIAQDRIEISGEAPRIQPGGTAYYAGVAATSLGLRSSVITKTAQEDKEPLLADLEEVECVVSWSPSKSSTRFVNIYPGPTPDIRLQRVESIADSFRPGDLDLRSRLYLLGPLTKDEIPIECVRRLAKRDCRIAMDLQGYARQIRNEEVVPAASELLPSILAHIDVVKASSDEAALVTGAETNESAAERLSAMGPSEVIITSGSRGALILAGGRCHYIPVVQPSEIVDTTGCGDTFMVSYLARRMVTRDIEEAGRFASAIAAEKMVRRGAFRGPVPANLSRNEDPLTIGEAHTRPG